MTTRGNHLRSVADDQNIPLRTIEQVRDSIERARRYKTEKRLAQLMLKHGRLTPDARAFLQTELTHDNSAR